MSLPEDQTEKEALIAELRQQDIKHNPEQIVAIAKLASGQIIFLEIGSDRSGLQHVILQHVDQFAAQGIEKARIAEAIMVALTQGEMIGYQGRGATRPIYRFTFNGQKRMMAITIGNNGYIVSANPRTEPPYRLIDES